MCQTTHENNNLIVAKKNTAFGVVERCREFYVFCFFFLAAGNKMLFKINRYPGEFGC